MVAQDLINFDHKFSKMFSGKVGAEEVSQPRRQCGVLLTASC